MIAGNPEPATPSRRLISMRILARAVLGVLLGLAVQGWGESDGPLRKNNARQPQQIVKGLRIHEWGVFAAGKAGGGGEPPTFVQRVPKGLPEAAAPAPIGGGPVQAREPVLHVYAPGPCCLRVEVSFPLGRPTLAWPRAEAGLRSQVPVLSWRLDVGGQEGAQPPKVPEDHWMAAARKAGGDLLRTPDGKDAERFLFYEGELKRDSSLKIVHEQGGMGPPRFRLSGEGPREIWIVAGRKELLRAHLEKRDAQPTPGDLEAVEAAVLQAELAQALTSAGLSEAEASALLGVWMPELVKPGERLVYLLPREEYDRLLPIAFDPMPEELVRVGLVLEEVNP